MRLRSATVVWCGALGITAGVLGGPLSPPGAPAPSMKTMQEAEPRVPIGPLTTPGDATAIYRIMQPGSYYLTEDVESPSVGQRGISVESSNVTLDLRGFTVDGAGVGGVGIEIAATRSNITIRNGRVTNWGGHGVASIDFACPGIVLEDLHSAGNGGSGILTPSANIVVRRCVADGNGATGIRIGSASTIEGSLSQRNGGIGFSLGFSVAARDCVSYLNGQAGSSAGFSVGVASMLIGCASRQNTGNGFTLTEEVVVESCTASLNGADGFVVGARSTVAHSTANANSSDGVVAANFVTIRGCTVTQNGAFGVDASDGSIITESTIADNGGWGVRMDNGSRLSNSTIAANDQSGVQIASSCVVEGNLIRGNGLANAGASGVHLIDGGSGNRIDGNHLADNPWGVRTPLGTSTLNVIIRNTVVGTTVAQQISVPGNVTAIPTATTPATTLPFANLVQ